MYVWVGVYGSTDMSIPRGKTRKFQISKAYSPLTLASSAAAATPPPRPAAAAAAAAAAVAACGLALRGGESRAELSGIGDERGCPAASLRVLRESRPLLRARVSV
jgi:hypothetical protein